MRQRRLFIDIDNLDIRGLTHRLGNAEKYSGNPVLRLGHVDAPDALQVGWPHTPMFDTDDGLWKMWYTAQGHERPHSWFKAYATSEDGLVWSKPDLGLVDYRGSKHNNIVMPPCDGPVGLGPVFKDPLETNPAMKFKSIRGVTVDGGYGFENPTLLAKLPMCSPDGLHWALMDPEYILSARWPALVEPRPTPCPPNGHLDIHQVIVDTDDLDASRRYKFYGQTFGPEAGESKRWHRQISAATAPTFGKAVMYERNPILDIEREHEIHFATVFKASNYYIMFHEYAVFEPIDGRYIADVRISISTDGLEFKRLHSTQPILARGETGAWDGGFIVTPSDIVEHDDKLWIYYSAGTENWHDWPGRAPSGFDLSPGALQSREIGLAWMRPDGFAYLTCEDELIPGVVTTTPISPEEISGKVIMIGLDGTQPRRSWANVEIIDAETGETLPGHGLEDSTRIFKDGLAVPVTWKDTNVCPATDRSVRLRFHLFGRTRLYSYNIV